MTEMGERKRKAILFVTPDAGMSPQDRARLERYCGCVVVQVSDVACVKWGNEVAVDGSMLAQAALNTINGLSGSYLEATKVKAMFASLVLKYAIVTPEPADAD